LFKLPRDGLFRDVLSAKRRGMLVIDDLTVRIAGRTLLKGASARIPIGARARRLLEPVRPPCLWQVGAIALVYAHILIRLGTSILARQLAIPERQGKEDRRCSDDCLRILPIVIKALMRKIALALIVVMLPTLSAAQQTNRAPKHLKKAVRPHTATGNPCAQYGAGFARIAGADTCIKIGGSVGAEAGGSSRR